jgi:hypothetical protein
LAAGIGEVAMPSELVVTVAEVLPLNVALAPIDGAVNVTDTPLTGFQEPSTTLAARADPNHTPAAVLCGVPDTATTDVAAAVTPDAVNTTSTQ